MGVLYFQLGIAAIIIFITLVHGQKAGFVASFIIAVLTFFNVFMPWLIALQLITICVSYNLARSWCQSIAAYKRQQDEARAEAEKQRQEREAQRQYAATVRRIAQQSEPKKPLVTKGRLIALTITTLGYFVYTRPQATWKTALGMVKPLFYLFIGAVLLLGLSKIIMRQYYRKRGMYWPDYGNGKKWREEYKDAEWLPKMISLVNQRRWWDLKVEANWWSTTGGHNTVAWFYLGLVHEMLDDLPAAVDFYTRAYQLNPLFRSPHLQLSPTALNVWERKDKSYIGGEQDKSGMPMGQLASDGASLNPDVTKAFDVLELHINASLVEIKAAYRKRMSEYHPDKYTHAGRDIRELAEVKAKEINEAYEVLKTVKGMS